jgi:rare lipoprotein A
MGGNGSRPVTTLTRWLYALIRLAGLALALSLAACATASAPRRLPTEPVVGAPSPAPSRLPIEPMVGATESGDATWYGPERQGRLTTSGEPFDMHKLTAAHPTLPLGTHLLVTNLKNGRTVQVRVNDRGPRAPGRVIDLSYAAAEMLGYVQAGLIPVRVQVLSLPNH